MLADGFIFSNELELLKIRFAELYPVVDRFILVESDTNFRGQSKPLYFQENKSLYSRFLDKLEYVYIDLNDIDGIWDKEFASREAILQGFTGDDPNDILVFGDVDEMPRRSTLENINPDPLVAIGMKMYIYGINLIQPGEGYSLKAVRRKAITSIKELRSQPPTQVIHSGGWHFSYFGGPEVVSEKLKSFSHNEYDEELYTDPINILYRINNHTDPVDRWQLKEIPLEDLPIEIRNNLEYWKKYVY